MVEKISLSKALLMTLWLLMCEETSLAGGFSYYFPARGERPEVGKTVIGFMQNHIVKEDDTLLDIARDYGLGFNEIELCYPDVDPWIPEAGVSMMIPTRWVLPNNKHSGLVINIPEMRLYLFFPKTKMVKTYPVGIGVSDWETPEGIYRIVERQADPTWVVPKSLREKYGVVQIPPGPDNPLGSHWLGLSRKGYGIHGTNFPWGVGRLVSHGCIRLYPEHIRQLFNEATVGTPVEIIYEPVKVGVVDRAIFIEIHPDIYGRGWDLDDIARERIQDMGLWEHVFPENLTKALQVHNGVPHYIGYVAKGGDRPRVGIAAAYLPPETICGLD